MSFVALATVVDAIDLLLPPLEDDEFGLSWSDLDTGPELEVTWAAYRSIAGHVISGAYDLKVQTVDEWMDAAL